MSVLVKREGVKCVATLPEGDWKLTVFRGRVLAISPGHPPVILGEDLFQKLDMQNVTNVRVDEAS